MKKRVKERATANRLSQGYLEGGDSDDEGVSLSAIKNKFKKNKRGGKYCNNSQKAKIRKIVQFWEAALFATKAQIYVFGFFFSENVDFSLYVSTRIHICYTNF